MSPPGRYYSLPSASKSEVNNNQTATKLNKNAGTPPRRRQKDGYATNDWRIHQSNDEQTVTKTKNAFEQSTVGSCTVFAAVCAYVSGKVIVDLSLNAASKAFEMPSKAKEYAQNIVQKLF
ncbi:hypothetical protein Ddc_11097 [Ditylenchus destructor]|nr:hypothetical protein Ddc_11097 [Ditylenchus destructor]